MAINRGGSCQEVCRVVRQKLENAKVLSVQDVYHGPMFDALEKVKFVPSADLSMLRIACQAIVEIKEICNG